MPPWLKHVVTYLVSQGRAMNVLVDVAEGEEGAVYEGPWTAPARSDEVAGQFSSWEPDVQRIMKVSQTTVPYMHVPRSTHIAACVAF